MIYVSQLDADWVKAFDEVTERKSCEDGVGEIYCSALSEEKGCVVEEKGCVVQEKGCVVEEKDSVV